MKLFDCFAYNGESKMLNFRLEELYSVIDYFIIVEANWTFKGDPKLLKFDISKYEKFKDKIIYKICDTPSVKNPWQNEANQRYFFLEGLKQLDLKDNDLILISDVDEIPDIKNLIEFKEKGFTGAKTFYQNFYYYNYKCRNIKKWHGTVILDSLTFKNTFKFNAEVVRQSRWRLPLIGSDYKSGGWHFSYCGGLGQPIENRVRYKIINNAHQEFNNENVLSHIDEAFQRKGDLLGRRIKRNYLPGFTEPKFKKVNLKNVLPDYISREKSKFSHLLLD
jgi:beta-1,4-mannosyl-glycoprotein beta-1,4-N-acetylglucosaminyltransferase